MNKIKQINNFIKSQKSIWLYKKVRKALKDVLLTMPDEDSKKIMKNTILVVLHEGALAQAMHFPAKNEFKIVQISVAKNVPLYVLRFVIAHEFGHVLQGRNWIKRDGIKLEVDANEYAAKIGFGRTKQVEGWKKTYNKRFE